MSDKDNYAPGTFNDPNAPWNEPEPIEDTDAFQDKQREIWDERITDIDGYFYESFSHATVAQLMILSSQIYRNRNGENEKAIGKIVSFMVMNYCKPTDDEVISALERQEL